MIVCNNGICLETIFLLSKELSKMVILGTLFLSMLYSFKVMKKGITSNLKGHEVCFKFTKEPNNVEIHNLKIQVIEKEKILYFLQEEVNHKIIK